MSKLDYFIHDNADAFRLKILGIYRGQLWTLWNRSGARLANIRTGIQEQA